jgi:hypothetical protein
MKLARITGTLIVALALSACSGMGPRPEDTGQTAQTGEAVYTRPTAGADSVQIDRYVSATVLFIADPQIHNVQGGNVKQTMLGADIVSHVAQRQPEINLMAPYALTALIRKGVDQQVKNPTSFMVILGDATNAGCTGEFDRFSQAVANAQPGRILLMAHGNHDSFLMGTINYWQSVFDTADVSGFDGSPVPVDASWWTPARGANGRGWPALCYEHGQSKVPINKVQWMGRYIKSLQGEHGLALQGGTSRERSWTESGKSVPVLPFSGAGEPGTPLAKLAYQVAGEWVRPEASSRGLLASYESYMVQAVNVGDSHRLIIIDTSGCAEFQASGWSRGIRYVGQNAGMNGCIGNAQIATIRSMAADRLGAGRQLVFAGHFPLEKIFAADRTALIDVMKTASGSAAWTYLSAHTHDPKSVWLWAGGKEINMGSTTDWPMSAYQVQFGEEVTAPTLDFSEAMFGSGTAFAYDGPWPFSGGAELCRHVDAAIKLSKWNPGNGNLFTSPGTWWSYAKCGVSHRFYTTYQERMKQAMDEIERRMSDTSGKEAAYQDEMLRIMAAASLNECRKRSVVRLAPDCRVR